MAKKHLDRDEALWKAKIEAKAFAASGRSVKLISLVILSEEFKFTPEQLALFLERFDETLEFYDHSKDYHKLLNEWNEYFKDTIGTDVLKWDYKEV